MKVQLAPKLIAKVKKQDAIIRKSFRIAIGLFSKDPDYLELNNHSLKRAWEGFRSIDVTSDLRAIYQQIDETDETFAYFVDLGTHDQLYGKHKKSES